MDTAITKCLFCHTPLPEGVSSYCTRGGCLARAHTERHKPQRHLCTICRQRRSRRGLLTCAQCGPDRSRDALACGRCIHCGEPFPPGARAGRLFLYKACQSAYAREHGYKVERR